MASSTQSPSTTSSPYPFAAAPDIIRAHQKDVYFQGLLTNQLVDLQRRLLGARSAHAWAAESRTAADLLYLCLTTLLGNRTLGEEYCDLVQVESFDSSNEPTGPTLPSLPRRVAYISSSILLPYALSRILPTVRTSLRKRLESRLADLTRAHKTHDSEYRAKRYLLTHLGSFTSGAHLHAATLALFYFSGAYYSIAKRLTGLRYVFTRRLPGNPSGQGDRAGYEVLGVLLVVQLAVQGYLHVRATLAAAPSGEEASVEAAIRERAFGPEMANVSLDHEHSYSSNNELLLASGATSGQRSKVVIGSMAHTPVPKGDGARFDLRERKVMRYVKERKCTLCLEELKDPSAMQCGHVFCWTCIGDWVREKPECPLCRREAMVQHILPLRMM